MSNNSKHDNNKHNDNILTAATISDSRSRNHASRSFCCTTIGRLMSGAPLYVYVFSRHSSKWVKGKIVGSTADTVTVQYETRLGLCQKRQQHSSPHVDYDGLLGDSAEQDPQGILSWSKNKKSDSFTPLLPCEASPLPTQRAQRATSQRPHQRRSSWADVRKASLAATQTAAEWLDERERRRQERSRQRETRRQERLWQETEANGGISESFDKENGDYEWGWR